MGCEDNPTSVEDFDVQPAVTPTSAGLSFTKGQVPLSTVGVQYQGLDAAPELVGSEGFVIEVAEESGTPESGSRTWTVDYTGELPSLGSIQDTLRIQAASGGRDILKTVTVNVASPVTVTNTYQNQFAVVEDYEERQITTSGGAVVEQVTDEIPPSSNGLNALRVDGPGTITVEREANLASGQTVFTFLAKPDPATSFDLEITFTEGDDGAEQTHTVTIPIESGTNWRKYAVAAEQVFEGFDPVAERAGGNGQLTSVSMQTDEAVTYYVDELAFGTSDGPTIEIHDFEATSFFYVGDTAFSDADVLADMSDGPAAQYLSFTEGGNYFGYNFQADGPALFVNATSDGVVSLIVGNVSRAFNLYVFLETAEGAFGYGTGVEVPIQAGDGFREVTVPIANLGSSLGALANPGITNVGFEIRRPESDTTTEPIEFVLDGIKLIGH